MATKFKFKRSCKSKRSYSNINEAEKVAKRMEGETGKTYKVYICLYCSNWHLATYKVKGKIIYAI